MKIKIINKEKSNIFIFGEDNACLVKNYFNKNKYFHYDLNEKYIYLNFNIIKKIIWYYIQCWNLKTAYLTSLVDTKTSYMCITVIDNNKNFFTVAKILWKKIRFVAIQNGYRNDFSKLTKSEKKKIFIPEYLCFGQNDIDRAKNIGAKISEFKVAGSLRAIKAYENFPLDDGGGAQYDICFISEGYAGYDEKYPGIENAEGTLAKFIYRYSIENKLSVAVAFKHDKKSILGKSNKTESEYLSKYIDLKNVNCIYKNENLYTSYFTALRSRVSIAMTSTLVLEIASLKKKVLVCDLYGEPVSLGICEPLGHINYDHNYERFANAITSLLNETEEEFYKARKNQIEYYMYNKGFPSVKAALDNLL